MKAASLSVYAFVKLRASDMHKWLTDIIGCTTFCNKLHKPSTFA